MYDQLIKGLMTELNALADTNFGELPAIVFMANLRDTLVFTQRFTYDEAEAIVTAMDIILPVGVLSSEQVSEFVVIYSKLICALQDGLMIQGFQDSVKVIVKMAPRLGLKFE